MKVHAVLGTLLSVVLALALTASAAAQELPGSVKGFKKETLEVYFNRADLERESSAWERVAKLGTEAAISEWEREATELSCDAPQAAQARDQLIGWAGRQMEDRYEKWLTRRFFEREGALGAEAVLRAISAADLQYLYRTDESGNVLLDEAGDPVLREADGLQADREGWKAKVASASDAVLAAWEQKVDTAFAPELGDLLGPEALSKFGEYKANVKAGLRREMEHVALQGELSLAARRLYDQYSLRKKSETATADSIADQIVKETQTHTAQGIAQIKAGLNLAPDAVDMAAPNIEAQRWLESFKAAFEKGLSQWDTAEEKFLVSRMEWERDAGKSYSEGEKAWSTAFEKLTTARKGWEQEVDQLLQTGAAKWGQARSELSSAISGARTEFQNECTERLSAMQDHVGALVDMYAQSAQVVSTAVSSGQELIRKLNIRDGNGEYVKCSPDADPAIIAFRKQRWSGYIAGLNNEIASLNQQKASIPAWVEQHLEMAKLLPMLQGYADTLQRLNSAIGTRTALVSMMSSVDLGASVREANPTLNEALNAYLEYVNNTAGDPNRAASVQADWERLGRLGDWLTMIDTYSAQAATAKQQMQEALGSAFGSDASDLRDVLKTDSDAGITYLDEYQLELLRAKAVQDYWTQRKAVADAVVAYAQDISSGRATEDEGEKNLASARSAYEAQLADYNRVLNELRSKGGNLDSARQKLEAAQDAVGAASTTYEEARQKYMTALASSQSGNVDFYKKQIEQKYSELLSAGGMTASDTGLADAATEYYAAARRYGYDLAVNSAWAKASELVRGNPESGLLSLADLKAAAEKLRVPASTDEIPADIDGLGVSLDSANYAKVSALFGAWKGAAGDSRTQAAWKLLQYLGVIAADANQACVQRLALIRAYGAADAVTWYAESGGKRTEGKLEERLSVDSAAAALSLIGARAHVEILGLEAWLDLQNGQTPSDKDALMLAQSAQEGLSQEEAQSRIEMLAALISDLNGASADVSGATSRLRALTRSGGWIQSFVGGAGSFVDSQAGDLTLTMCTDQYQEANRAQALVSAWMNASANSIALVAEREASALDSIKKVFSDHQLSLKDDDALPSSEDVATLIRLSDPDEAATFVSGLTQALQEAASTGPRWLADRITDYCSAIAGYAAAEAGSHVSAQTASVKAASAEAAAAADSSTRSNLRTLAEEFQGGSRLSALMELYTRNDKPSASAASAHDLIVDSGAIEAAKRSLADTSISLQSIAADLAPGMTTMLASEIAAEAQKLLDAQKGQGPTGERVAAFRTWSTLSVSQAIAGLVVSSFAADAKRLWDEVASKTWSSQQLLSEALAGYLASSSESSPASDQIKQLCSQLEYGLDDRDALFRRFLFGNDFDARLSSLAATGAAGTVYQRAIALTVASQSSGAVSGRQLASFLLDRTGITGVADAADFAGTASQLEQTAFSGSGDLAVEYLCKNLVLRGVSIPEDLEKQLAKSSAATEKVNQFKEMLGKVRGYVAALDGNAQAYAHSLGGDFMSRDALAASISAGQWNDDLFAAGSNADYLNWYDQMNASKLDAAGQMILEELALASVDFSSKSAVHSAEASYWRQVERQPSKATSWRVYLTGNVGTSVTVESATSAQTRDGNGYVHCVSDSAENVTLDAFNSLAQQENAFVSQLAATRDDGGSVARFRSFLEAFAAGNAKASDLPVSSEQEVNAAEGAYRSELAKVQSLKDDIRRFGEALKLLDLGSEERQAELDELRNSADNLAIKVANKQVLVDTALGDFEGQGALYNTAYAELQISSKSLEKARFMLRVSEEIQDWASNGYLTSRGEAAQSYQSPVQMQTDVSEKLTRAAAAVDALKELYGESPVTDRPIGDAATLAAYDAWKTSYAELLRLKRVTGELDEATTEQGKKVEEQFESLQKARDAILDGSRVDANLTWSDNETERAGNWTSYLTFQNGRLSLDISVDFKLHAQQTKDEWQTVKDYFDVREAQGGDPAEAAAKSDFERHLEAWQTTVNTYAAKFGGMSALIDRWGFAADYLKRRLYDSNGSGSLGYLENYQSDDKFMRDNNYLDIHTSGEDLRGAARDCLRAAVTFAQSQYSAVMENADERDAFEFYFAVRMASAGGNENQFDQFNSRTSASALRMLTQRLQDTIERLRANRRAPFGWISDAVADWTGQASALDNKKGDIETLLNGFSPNILGSSISTFTQARRDYESGCARLAELRGTDGAHLTSVEDFLSQYRKLAAQSQGIATDLARVSSELEAQFRSAWSVLAVEDKVSFSKALQEMTVMASVNAEDARGKTVLAAQAAEAKAAEAQQAYRSAYEAYVAGTGTKADMLEAAKSAYRDSLWVAKADQELLSGVLGDAAFSAGVLLNDSESNTRMNALQSYAQAVLSVYSGALKSRETELEQKWGQSVQDLGSRQQTWYAQVGLVRAKAASAWDESQQKLVEAFGQWREGFQQEYGDKSDAWNVAYLGLVEKKDDWVQATREKAAKAGNEAILGEVGASADDSSRSASTLLIGDISYDPNEAATKVQTLLAEVGSGQSLTALKRMSSGIAPESVTVAGGKLGADTSGARIASEVKRFIATSRKELSALAARGLADDARTSVEEAKKALSESVKEANKGFEKSMDEVFVTVGYGTDGGEYKREAVKRSTLISGLIMETQRVEAYRWYAMPRLELKVDLSQGRLNGLEAGAVMDLVGIAQEEVGEQQNRIFGEGKKLTDAEKRAKGLVFEITANGEAKTKELGEGEFGQWVGYSPEFAKEPDFDKSQNDNIVVQGKGELGRLMGAFIWNQTKEARGWSEVQKPTWDKALWDDTGSWFKAPSLRTVGSIAAGVVATLATGGIGGIAGIAATAAISTSSTLLFDTLDVVSGYKTWEEAGLDIGKSFLTSAATSTVGGVFNGFNPKEVGGIAGALGDFGKAPIGKALLAGAQGFTTNTATSALSAFSWSNGKLGWDKDAFLTGSFGTGAWASVAGASGSAFTSGLMSMANMVDGNGTILSSNVFNTRGISSFNNLTGGLVSTGIQYGMTGDATLNLMNIADFGSERGYGLLEMHLGAKQGFSMNLGSNGTNVSLGTIASSMGGVGESYKITKAKYENLQGDKTALTTLNSANGLGYTDNKDNYQLAKDIWNGNKNVVYYNASTPAVTTQDLAALAYAGDDGKSIYVNSKLLGGGKEGAAQVASIMSHEAKHLAGKDEFESRMTETSAYSDLMKAWGVTGAGYEDTGLAWGASMLRKIGAGGYGFVLDAQIASLPVSSSGRVYDQAPAQDLGILAQTQLRRAITSTNTESNNLWDYLVQSGDKGKIADILWDSGTFSNFTAGVLSEEAYGSAFALLGGLRDALKDSTDFAAGSILSHDMLQYTTNVFRGSNGMNGLSGALFLANLASEDVVRAGNATGYLINDVARTYEGEYLNINYDRTGAIAGDLTGAQYYMNFNLKGPGYGQAITGYFNGPWVSSPTSTPSLDCIGYVNTVLYASGALKAGQALNASVKGNKTEVGIWSREYTSAHAAQLDTESGIVANGLSRTFLYGGWPQMVADKKQANQYVGGVLLAYGDDRKTWSDTPQVGDLVFMQGHIGFYGVNDLGQNILSHSAPEYAAESGSYWEPGPRENLLGSWTNQKPGNRNDGYINMLIRNRYFTKWTDQFNTGYPFGRIKPWWNADSFSRR